MKFISIGYRSAGSCKNLPSAESDVITERSTNHGASGLRDSVPGLANASTTSDVHGIKTLTRYVLILSSLLE
ncbi:uncharacterized protein BDW70DRAFT_145742 [Aspergillus foveolatus]|uniref:uncharacterized protein n=1 Tax=Aspergillus foveolatus TaxID=210207 RepID=UPI003CCCD9C9